MVLNMFYKRINDHNVHIKDLRPLGSKQTKICMKCGITGLRNLKRELCTIKDK